MPPIVWLSLGLHLNLDGAEEPQARNLILETPKWQSSRHQAESNTSSLCKKGYLFWTSGNRHTFLKARTSTQGLTSHRGNKTI